MKIAILTSGILPIPAVQGGAVENHIDFYLAYNEKKKLHEITVFSVYDKKIKGHPALQSIKNHYVYIETKSPLAIIQKRLFYLLNKETYYHYTIEFFFHKALKYLEKGNYDVILLDNRPGYALKLRHLTNSKIIYYLHNDLLNKVTKQCDILYKTADKIITVSDYISHCVRTINPNDKKCITVHNGIDIDAFSPNIKPIITRINLNLSSKDFVILYSGRVIPEKGVLELIRSLKRIDNVETIKLLIIGSTFYANTSNESPFIHTLKEEAFPIKNSIIFTGYIPYNILPDYLRLSDIAVVPSIWEEPFGNTVVEAMAAGLPLITTRSGGIPEICEGVATIVERENIVENLTNAILDLYQHPDKRKQMSTASLERSKLFDKETYARNFFAAIEEC